MKDYAIKFEHVSKIYKLKKKMMAKIKVMKLNVFMH